MYSTQRNNKALLIFPTCSECYTPGPGSVLCVCDCCVRSDAPQDQQLRRPGEPPQLPADPLSVRGDVSVWHQPGAGQHLPSATRADSFALLPGRLHPVQVGHNPTFLLPRPKPQCSKTQHPSSALARSFRWG